MIILYRHLRGKYQARQAKLDGRPPAPAPEASQTSSSTRDDVQPSTPPAPSKVSWRSHVLLMIALVIPVFLETLDYTGTHDILRILDLQAHSLLIQWSLPPRFILL